MQWFIERELVTALLLITWRKRSFPDPAFEVHKLLSN